ncbi:ornithine cyclodeaminase family protein [Embleya sp. MST-111070]|uniref:ornithine cyclodeaminase family protein n=1 Tax=Embleya sp. MST-111070 TaxID=3398231 RepID=UPI003F74011B
MTRVHTDVATADVTAVAGLIREALHSGAVRRMTVPLRQTVEDTRGVKYLSMPAVSTDLGLYIAKVATIAHGPGSTVTSVVPVFATSTGALLTVLDGALVTNLKCAAVTAVVTDRCATPDAAVLGIVGAGVQAWQQYLGVRAVRDIALVRVHSRTPAHAEALCARIRAAGRARALVCASAAEATSGADVVATATTSVDPLPIAADLPAHVHVNCMGAHTTTSREVSRELLASATVVVESIETAVAEAGVIHRTALDLEALETGDHPGLADRPTVFSSTGHASLDLITCAHLARPYR